MKLGSYTAVTVTLSAEAEDLVQRVREARRAEILAHRDFGIARVLASTYLVKNGFSTREAAKLLGVSHTTVARDAR